MVGPIVAGGVDLPVLPGRIPTATAAWTDETDVIVIGTGAAGLSTAVRLLDAGRRVSVITKAEPGDGSTAWAQGGLAAVLGSDDTIDSHLDDTLVAGAGLCEADAVRELVISAPGAIRRMIELGAHFDLDRDERIALGLEGGHHARRIVHAGGDASGAEVARALAAAFADRALSLSRSASTSSAIMRLHEHTTVVDLLTDDHGVHGVRVIDSDGLIGEITATAVVLASGGIGQAWDTTTNPATATGDGLALALRAGAVLRDLEFTQFHPTVLVVPEEYRRPGDRGVLVSEAVRGEGAVLVDRHGELIMKGRHPLADLAPRDVVSATMHAHLMASGDDHLFLDGTHLGEHVWREHFPSILMLCQARGVDPIHEPIPVRPAEHYSCGGVLATLDGRTTVPGLYAVGEVASTGVQGANRLASNSLTEALIAGDRVGQLLAAGDPEQGRPNTARNRTGFATPAAHRESIVRAVSTGAGVLRDETGLDVLLKSLDQISTQQQATTVAEVEATNLHTVGVLVAAAAQQRTESRGCHRRADFTAPDVGWQRHTLLRLGVDGLEISQQAKES
ncbi:L-aspartate oxidase [Microlunatus endophyticus]|nr:L-aspartate oxidase [Microlunatus endophyticus]